MKIQKKYKLGGKSSKFYIFFENFTEMTADTPQPETISHGIMIVRLKKGMVHPKWFVWANNFDCKARIQNMEGCISHRCFYLKNSKKSKQMLSKYNFSEFWAV